MAGKAKSVFKYFIINLLNQFYYEKVSFDFCNRVNDWSYFLS